MKGAFYYSRGVVRAPISASPCCRLIRGAAGYRESFPLSHSVPAFWQSSLQSLKGHCCAQCKGIAALPSTAFALPLCSPFPTITSDTKERTISWLLGKAEHDPFSLAPSRGEALQL